MVMRGKDGAGGDEGGKAAIRLRARVTFLCISVGWLFVVLGITPFLTWLSSSLVYSSLYGGHVATSFCAMIPPCMMGHNPG